MNIQVEMDDSMDSKNRSDVSERERLRRSEYDRIRRANMTEEERLKVADYYRQRRANMSEKERLKRNEYRRIQYANMTAEQRMKNAEYYRKQYANMSEEERMKKSEYYRQRQANMTEEKRLKKKEYNRKRRLNMTEEQRLKRVEYLREQRANMTEEDRKKRAEKRRIMFAKRTEDERIRKNEYQRKQHANMTEQQRLKKVESDRRRRANMTEEKKMKTMEVCRIRRENMTEEKRLQKLESDRKRRANMTEEERVKITESCRRRRANMTEEQRLRKAENDRKRRANMTDEQKKKHVSEECSLTENQTANNCLTVLTEEQLIMKAGYNPLVKLIMKMTRNHMDLNIISGLSMDLLQGILQLLGIECAFERKELNFASAIHNLICEIDLYYLVELLRNWEGWVVSKTIKHLSYDTLFSYLKRNISDFILQRKAFLPKELNNLFNGENFISVTCSFKQLQTLFYPNPRNCVKFDSKAVTKPLRYLKFPKYIIVWPHISTRITLPNFSMTHQNNHIDEYTLLNMTGKLNKNKINNFVAKQMIVKKNPEKYLKCNVAKFLNQLRNTLIDKVSGKMTIEKKAETILALTTFEIDLAQCPDIIESNCHYNRCPSVFPYVRYLGCSDADNICVSMSDQNDSALNVRLQQIRHPNMSFLLDDFNVSYDVKSKGTLYLFDELFLHGINTCISYSCTLCNEYFGSCNQNQILSEHFSKYHGLEPDWECTNCAKSFNNNYLLNNGWKHDCE